MLLIQREASKVQFIPKGAYFAPATSYITHIYLQSKWLMIVLVKTVSEVELPPGSVVVTMAANSFCRALNCLGHTPGLTVVLPLLDPSSSEGSDEDKSLPSCSIQLHGRFCGNKPHETAHVAFSEQQ